MILKGKLHMETPIYRGNARKTLFTRDGDGTHRLLSLAEEVSGTAQSLMDAFIGQSRNGKNIGLLNQLWSRLYGSSMPNRLITGLECKLEKKSYPQDRFFDLRMGIKLDEDRWAAEANANYKMETLFRNSVFDFVFSVNEDLLKNNENQAKLYYLLHELIEGRFWFGAGKSKGLGRVRLETDIPFSTPKQIPALYPRANHLRIDLVFDAMNPVLVGWNWGKLDPEAASFADIEGRLLVASMRELPDPIRDRLEKALGGPILSPEDWKQKFTQYLPRVIGVWLRERSLSEVETWILPFSKVVKLGKGKHAISNNILAMIKSLEDKDFPTLDDAEDAIKEALGKKANMAKRIVKVLESTHRAQKQLDNDSWLQVADSLGLDRDLSERLADNIEDESALVQILTPACLGLMPRLYQQVDQQIRLIQSDSWVDSEILDREEHVRIKTMLMNGKIDEYQWGDPEAVPEGVNPATWREFTQAHSRVRYRHMLDSTNLDKSIANDNNLIEFLKAYRNRTRQELAQPHHIDFRAGGASNREISRKYGKPYDNIFMRMLTWAPSSQMEGSWETYIPGSTIKGAFRKRASQTLKTLWGETAKATEILINRLFGTQGQRGLLFFSDAYLANPHNPDNSWCSMDGIRIDPKTGRPIETAKHDFLFAYGNHLRFQLRIDIQDIEDQDMEAISLLFHLLRDFKRGDIPLGGQKTSGLGWVKAKVNRLVWLATDSTGVGEKLFGKRGLTREGIWWQLEVEGDEAARLLQPIHPLLPKEAASFQTPPRAKAGFVSHKAFGGLCGTLKVEARIVTPISVRESGQPSSCVTLEDGPVNGWDFFSISPPEASNRTTDKVYALPGKSIRGLLRHVYSIASDSKEGSPDLSRLNPVDSLFGWVGKGPNNAITGRVSLGFGIFKDPEMAWFKVPYPYGGWRFTGKKWEEVSGGSVHRVIIEDMWRVFPHAPLAPIVEQLTDFKPDTSKTNYFRAILPGARACFDIRFWNLLEEELQRLVWCVVLEPDLAHKMGNNRHLGFGSLKMKILRDSFLIDWNKRYSGKSEESWRLPVRIEEWLNPDVIEHYAKVKKVFNAEQL